MPTRKATATKRPSATTTPAKTVDDYIAAAPKDKRAALTKLRQTIKAAAPKATEIISYGMVGYKQGAKRVAYFAYWKTHIALYGTSYDFIKTKIKRKKSFGRIHFYSAEKIIIIDKSLHPIQQFFTTQMTRINGNKRKQYVGIFFF